MPMASDALSPATVHKSRSSSKPAASRAAHPTGGRRTTSCEGRCAWRRGSGHRWATGRRSVVRAPNCVVLRRCRGWSPRCGAHVPAVGDVQIAGGLEMFGDQRSVLLGRCRVMLFDCGCDAPVQLGAIRLELRFVGHSANQRMVERILRLSA